MFLASSLLAAAVVAVASPEPTFTTTGAFFAVSVPDVDASAAWYREKLGLKVVMQPPEIEGSRMIALEGGGLLVELIEHDGSMPRRQAAPAITRDYQMHGMFKAGIMVDEWDRLVKTLREREVPVVIGPFPATAEQRANLIIRDNDGNYIQFFGDYARPGP